MFRGLLGGGFAAWMVLALSPSAHAQECETDADCPAGLACEQGPSTGTACGPMPCDAGPPISLPGECKAQEVRCASNADCPLGLSCVERATGGGDVDCAFPDSRDGGADASTGCEPAEPVEPAEPERACAFDPGACETDADCEQAGFGCLAVEAGAQCSVSRQICAPGTDCDAAVSEPVCDEPEVIRYCFPERQDCSQDSDCATGWVCLVLPEEVQRDPLPGWEDASQLCLPSGLALALEGKIELGDSDFIGGGGSSDSRGSDEGSGAGRADTQGGGDAGTAADGPSGAKKDDGGCAVASVGSARAGGELTLALLAVCGRLLRRRSR